MRYILHRAQKSNSNTPVTDTFIHSVICNLYAVMVRRLEVKMAKKQTSRLAAMNRRRTFLNGVMLLCIIYICILNKFYITKGFKLHFTITPPFSSQEVLSGPPDKPHPISSALHPSAILWGGECRHLPSSHTATMKLTVAHALIKMPRMDIS